MVINRGEIWWASLPDARGSEPANRRPVLIIQSDDFNASRLGTVIVASITSNVRLAEAPGNVLLRKRETGLRKDSVANVSQLHSLDKSFLHQWVRVLPAPRLRAVDDGLRLVLSL